MACVRSTWRGRRRQLQMALDDIGEKNDLADKHPETVARIETIMMQQHIPSAVFPLNPIDPPAK